MRAHAEYLLGGLLSPLLRLPIITRLSLKNIVASALLRFIVEVAMTPLAGVLFVFADHRILTSEFSLLCYQVCVRLLPVTSAVVRVRLACLLPSRTLHWHAFLPSRGCCFYLQ